MQENVIDQSRDMTILEILDRVLNKGIVLSGDLVVSVADIDLVYVGVRLLLSSVETIEQIRKEQLEGGKETQVSSIKTQDHKIPNSNKTNSKLRNNRNNRNNRNSGTF